MVPPAVTELADIDAAEQPERIEPPARLRDGCKTERLALLQRELTADAGRRDRLIAGDQDVLDQGLRTLHDPVRQVDGSQAVVETRLHRHYRAVIAGVEIQRVDAIPVCRHLPGKVRTPDSRLHRRGQFLAGPEPAALDQHRPHGRLRPLDNVDGADHAHDRVGRIVGGRQLRDERFDAHRRVPEPAVVLGDQIRADVEIPHHQRGIRLDRH